jgi:hypothetical protein
VLSLTAPHVDLEEAGVAVAPLAVLLDALGDRHTQVGDRGAGVGEPQFRDLDQVAGVVVWLSAAIMAPSYWPEAFVRPPVATWRTRAIAEPMAPA